jgi:hypothetical protein
MRHAEGTSMIDLLQVSQLPPFLVERLEKDVVPPG